VTFLPVMKWKSNDPIFMHSSFALLQQRFKQLQRIKKMQKEREYLRMLSESKQVNPTNRYDPSRFFN
ncbi:unnamed protein product, partial [Ilex paraguariensis]